MARTLQQPGPVASFDFRWLRFLLGFAVVFLATSRLHQATRERTAPVMVGVLSTQASAGLINLLTPAEHAAARANRIQGTTSLLIGQGCDGVDGVLLLLSAVLAFPAGWKRKAQGVLLGLPLLYVSNLVRIVTLYYVQRSAPGAFAFMHEYVGQTFFILVGGAFFLGWSGALARPRP
ncbi:MAG: exosortase/archaeosortase family protein [Archangium sp.]|nr:exosortase/archaeosortase family protein [Archangium sp.]